MELLVPSRNIKEAFDGLCISTMIHPLRLQRIGLCEMTVFGNDLVIGVLPSEETRFRGIHDDEIKKINAKVIELDLTADVTKIKGDLKEAGDGIKRVNRDLAEANGTIATIDRRTKDVQKDAGLISAKQNTMQSQLVNLTALNVTEVQGSIGQIGAILNRVDVLEKTRTP